MKIILKENERGFLFKNGVYKRMLLPGKNKVRIHFNETYYILDISKPVAVNDTDIAVFMKDPAFAASVVKAEVPDGFIALHREDGRIQDILKSGAWYYWNCYREHDFILINIENPEISNLSPEALAALPKNAYTRLDVREYEVCLLYYNGKLNRQLDSGSYYFWNNSMTNVEFKNVDLRSQQLDISGQEILTADKVALRINFIISYRVTDAVRITNEINEYKQHIYTLTQLALREYIGRFRLDEILEQKDSVAGFVLGQLRAGQDRLYVEFIDAGLKDIILPGEIRDIMNTVLVAEKKAQANVISRREEVASTRSLLNTARLMDENTTLYKLKELEYLERICERVGNISVNGGNLIGELKDILSTGKQ